MRNLALLGAASALIAGMSVASADQTTGTIRTIDESIGDNITLSSGQTFFLPDTVPADSLAVGEKVTVVFDAPYGKQTAIAVLQEQAASNKNATS